MSHLCFISASAALRLSTSAPGNNYLAGAHLRASWPGTCSARPGLRRLSALSRRLGRCAATRMPLQTPGRCERGGVAVSRAGWAWLRGLGRGCTRMGRGLCAQMRMRGMGVAWSWAGLHAHGGGAVRASERSLSGFSQISPYRKSPYRVQLPWGRPGKQRRTVAEKKRVEEGRRTEGGKLEGEKKGRGREEEEGDRGRRRPLQAVDWQRGRSWARSGGSGSPQPGSLLCHLAPASQLQKRHWAGSFRVGGFPAQPWQPAGLPWVAPRSLGLGAAAGAQGTLLHLRLCSWGFWKATERAPRGGGTVLGTRTQWTAGSSLQVKFYLGEESLEPFLNP